MAKLGLILAGFVGGLLVSVAIVALLWAEIFPPTTEVWEALNDVQLMNGIVIPAGTEMVVDNYMPEGFVRLSLYINVEGASLAEFNKRTEQVSNLKIPYWVEQ